MSENPVVRARIDKKTKIAAEAILATMGLTVSDAFRMMMMRVAVEKALPFGPLVPNETTIKAMKEVRAGKVKKVKSVKHLIASLNDEDD